VQRVAEVSKDQALRAHSEAIAFVVMACVLIVAPMFAYPVFLMKALCFALFACAFNLLIGYVGLLSFGHALFFGWASYVGAHAAKVWGFPPELAILSGTAAAAGLGAVQTLSEVKRTCGGSLRCIDRSGMTLSRHRPD
jgi:branched-chain amino acid transport system permease protein